ncbi:MAG: lipid-A-disaccharide synthase, partial [Proteobacteria bacterium]|nr:lipid-A-disaccharide synthase [Pseudomonadota bacterium]
MMITRESPPASRRPLRCCLIAGEESGDRLGAALIRSLRRRQPAAQFFGVGGRDMEQEGFHGLFPIADIAVAGFANPVRRLPLILRRIREAARAVVEGDPD